MKKAKVIKDYNEKISVIRSKGSLIQDLIAKAKSSGNVDSETQGILSKWESANQKIFDTYPEEPQNDLSLLQQALEEVHAPKPTTKPADEEGK